MLRHLSAAIALAGLSATTLAASAPVPYFFGSAGYSRVDLSEVKDTITANTGITDIRSKDSSLSYGGGVGLNLNDHVSFEAHYMHMGEFQLSGGGSRVDGSLNGVGLGVVGFHPLSRDTALFARADAIYTHVNVNGDTAEEWQPAAGLGVEHNLGDGLHVRGQYQRIFLRSDDLKAPVDNLSLSLLQAF